MEKKILYICLILVTVYAIYQNVSNRSKKFTDNSISELKNCIEIEDLTKGRILFNAKLIDNYGNQTDLYSTLSKFDNEYSLVIITSMEACSTCREQNLTIWNTLYKEKKKLPIILLISEQTSINNTEKRRILASLKGINVDIPVYFDEESVLLKYLGVTAYQTPLSFILSRNKQIIATDKASTTKYRTELFRDFFSSLNSFGE